MRILLAWFITIISILVYVYGATLYGWNVLPASNEEARINRILLAFMIVAIGLFYLESRSLKKKL